MSSDQVPKLRSRSTISAELPVGWEFTESYTLLAPGREANIIFSSEPVHSDMDSETYARDQGVLLRSEFPGFRQIGQLERFYITGLPEAGWLREFSWVPPKQEEVRQMQLYAARSGRGFTVTATSPELTSAVYSPELLSVLQSLIIDVEAADRFAADQPATDQSEILK